MSSTDPANTIASLADQILYGDDTDVAALVSALRPVMAPTLHAELCVALELCPEHGDDYRICVAYDVEACGRGSRVAEVTR